jgi:hypothetical protein
MPTQLSLEQIRFYQTFGFVVLKNLLTPAEMARLQHEFSEAMAWQHPEGYDGSKRHNAVLMDADTPTFASLLEDARFLDPVRQLYGEDVLGICVDGNRYVGDTGWHTDSHSPYQSGTKFCIYLQPVRATSGALRILPASHHLFPWSQQFSDGMYNTPLQDIPAYSLDSDPGDVVAFDFRCWHASCGGAADRRMCTLCYYKNPRIPEEYEEMRKRGIANVEALQLAGCGGPRPYLYSSRWMQNPENSATRRQWIERLHQLQYFAPGLVEGDAVAPRT